MVGSHFFKLSTTSGSCLLFGDSLVAFLVLSHSSLRLWISIAVCAFASFKITSPPVANPYIRIIHVTHTNQRFAVVTTSTNLKPTL